MSKFPGQLGGREFMGMERLKPKFNTEPTSDILKELGLEQVKVYPTKLEGGIPTFITSQGDVTLGETGYFFPENLPEDTPVAFLLGAPSSLGNENPQHVILGRERAEDGSFHKRASGEHAIVIIDHDEEGHVTVTLIALDSKNGTFVNGEKLDPFEARIVQTGYLGPNGQYLNGGDTIQFGGENTFVFVDTPDLPIKQFRGQKAELTLVQNPLRKERPPEGHHINAGSWEELEKQVREHGPFEGSRQTFSVEDILEILKLVRAGKLAPTAVTKTGGLREAVQGLLKADEDGGTQPTSREPAHHRAPYQVHGMPTTHREDEIPEGYEFPDLGDVPCVDLERAKKVNEVTIPDLPNGTIIGLYPFDAEAHPTSHPDSIYTLQVHETKTGERVIRIWRSPLEEMPSTPSESRDCPQFQQGVFSLQETFLREGFLTNEEGRIRVYETLVMPYFLEGKGRGGAIAPPSDASELGQVFKPGMIKVIYPK